MRLQAWVDGGARGNPGPAGYGVVIDDAAGRPLVSAWGFLGETTNNVAEYRGLIAALAEALALGATGIVVRTDSELIQRQVVGKYKVRQPHLRELFQEVRGLAAKFDRFSIVHVPREKNARADALVNRAIDERTSGREAAA
jgi:ribonuclease HI